MTNKELIQELVCFPMDLPVCIDRHPSGNMFNIESVEINEKRTEIWITNYK